ncbi:MAG: right-handed parallel beta-helix repeat-containing protein [Bdellovibrionota bacterium]
MRLLGLLRRIFQFGFLLTCIFNGSAFADGCDAIRLALDLLPPDGGIVHIPPGTYLCETPLVLDRNGVALDGDGQAILKLADNSNAPLVIMGEVATPPRAVYDISVANLTLEGNREHQQYECWGGPCDSGGNAFIRNNGLTIRGVVRGKVSNVFISGARSGGVVTERHCQELNINGLSSTDNFFDGFAGYQTYRSTFANLNLSRNHAAGISLDLDFSENIVRNASLRQNGDVGIFMRGSNQNIFADLTIEGSGSHGIFLAEAGRQGTCANFNEFANLSVLGSKGFGFLLNNACIGNQLTGQATFIANSQGCIKVADGAKLDLPRSMICHE